MVDRLKAIAAHQGKSIAQLAIAWVLDNPAVTVALVGIRRTEELKENEYHATPTRHRLWNRSCRPADRNQNRRGARFSPR